MKQEDIQLLLQDLCARLPYGIICEVEYKDSEGWKMDIMILEGIFKEECYFVCEKGSTYSSNFKPYLRPMSSMTDEEYKAIRDCFVYCGDEFIASGKAADYLNSHHFDYRGLIDKGLAIAVTKDNNPYK